MNLLTRQHLCQAAPLRFAMQYRDRMDQQLWNGTIPQETYNQLVASDLTPESINRIMGNDSWTRLTCNACRKTVDRVIDIDVTSGEYTTHICEECVREMAGLMDGARQQAVGVPTVASMSHKFESSFQIGQRVHLNLQGVRIEGHVRAIIFTASKVRYSVRVLGDETTLHNVDSVFVFSEPDAEIAAMPEDNYS